MPPPPTAKKALIFGVSGQDGAYLAQFLLGKGYEVWGTSRDASSAHENLVRLGIRDRVHMLSVYLTDLASGEVPRGFEKQVQG